MLMDASWLRHGSITPQMSENWVSTGGVPPITYNSKPNREASGSLENTIPDFLSQFLRFVIIPLSINSK